MNLLAEGQSNLGSIILIVVMVVVIIGMFVWQSISSKKKQKEAQDMVSSLKVGDRIKTIGGICGFLVEIDNNENTFVLETGTKDKKSYIKFDKAAIYQTGPANPNKPEEKAETVKAEETKEETPKVEAVKEEDPFEKVEQPKPAKKTSKKKAE